MAQLSLSCSSFSPIKELPQEILLIVLKQVRNISTSSSFVSCLLVCRRWCDLGLSLLHSLICLTNSNLENFLNRFSHANCVLVRSLTVKINTRPPKDSESRYIGAKLLSSLLPSLATMISKMSTLLVFSFVVARKKMLFPRFGVPTSIITLMIENLSNRCVHLEIDIQNLTLSGLRSVHLCEKIRDILPRLQHFRVRLFRLCPAMILANFNKDGTIEGQPINSSAPSLKTFIINYPVHRLSDGLEKSSRVCRQLGEPISDLPRYFRSQARHYLATTLQDLLIRCNYPEIEGLWLLNIQSGGDDPAECQRYSFNRPVMVLNKTSAIPYTFDKSFWRTGPVHKEPDLVLTPEGDVVACSMWGFDDLAEPQIWQETLSGCRMPAMIMRDHL